MKQSFRFNTVGTLLFSWGAKFSKSAASFSVLAALVLTLGLSPTRAMAQSQNTGTVSGNVVDAQGKAVINATVTLTSNDEGTVTTQKVSDRGEYVFSNVKPGQYSLSVTAPTFEKYTANQIEVNATENARQDASLTAGSANETVTVEAPSATVDTRSATIATVIDPTLVQNLPVDGNNVVALAALLPGVTDVNAPTTFTSDTGGPTYVVAGSRNNQNLFLFDGAFWNNVYYNTGLNFPPPLMLQEVSVQLVNFKAQYGRNVGSIFNALTLSGTNTIHGKLWEYAQNHAFNASDYITHRNPHLVQNQFGASVGGPIIRDKLFFFLGVQDLRSSAEVDGYSQLPTAAERGLNQDGVTPRACVDPHWAGQNCAYFGGDYQVGTNLITGGVNNPYYHGNSYQAQAVSEIRSTASTQAAVPPNSPPGLPPPPAGGFPVPTPCGLGGNNAVCQYPYSYNAKQCDLDLAVLANDPTTTGANGTTFIDTQFPNAEIPYECFNPVTFNFYSKYLPIPLDAKGVPVTTPTNELYSALQPRNDWNGLARADYNTGHHSISATYFVTSVNDITANAITPTSTSIATYDQDSNYGGIISGNIGDTWVLRPNLLNLFRVAYKRYAYTTSPLDHTTLIDLGGNFTDPAVVPTLPRFSANQRFSIGSTNSAYSYALNSDTEYDDNMTLTKGNHNIQFGGQFLSLQYIHRFDTPLLISSPATYTGLGIADFTLGLIGSESVGNATNISAAEHALYFYGQDDWRITSRMTLNLGLRYELAFPWFQPDGQSVTFVPGYQSYKFPNVPASLAFQGDPGIPNAIIRTAYNNLAPRFGFSYDVFGNGRTAIRGGFGIFYDALNANTTGVGQPYHYGATYVTPDGSFSKPLQDLNPVPANYTGPASAVFTSPISVNFADPNVAPSYTEAVNFGIQQKIASAVMDILYVGKFGRHQLIPYDLNPDIYDCSGSYFQANPLVYCDLNGGSAASNQASDTARVTYPGFNYGGQGIVDNNSVGTSNYNALQIIYTQRARGNLTTTASYTYSRSLDDQSSGTTNSNALPHPPNVNTNYGPSDFQATQILNAGWTLKLPTMAGGNKVERAILNDWSFGGIFNARTGNPFTPVLTTDKQLNAEPNQRAPLAPGLTHYQPLPSSRHRVDKVNEWYNYCSFSANFTSTTTINPCGGTSAIANGFTNGVSRNILYGPAFIDTDLSLRRVFQTSWRGSRFELRGDAFNAWNTPNLANPVTAISGTASTVLSLDHGEIQSTVGKNGSVGTNGRRVQIALIFIY